MDWVTRRREEASSPEQRLAQAKLLVMLQDLGGKAWGYTKEREKLRNDALWFFSPCGDYAAWCEMAGFTPSVVLDKAMAIYEQGWPRLRAAAGTGKRYLERKDYWQKEKKRKR